MAVLAFIVVGAVALVSLAWWLLREKRIGVPPLIDPDLFKSALFRLGITGQLLQQVALGGTMIALPLFLQMVLEYNAFQAGLTPTPLSLSMFAVAIVAGKRAGRRRPAAIIRAGFALLAVATLAMIFVVPRTDTGWWPVIPLLVSGTGLGLLVSQLNNYTLSPIEEVHVARGGQRQLGGRFVRPLLRPCLRRRDHARHPRVLFRSPGARERRPDPGPGRPGFRGARRKCRSDDQHPPHGAVGRPNAEVQAEIIRINTEARPVALQVALLVPLLAAVIRFLSVFRMVRQPDPVASAAAEMMVGG